KGTRINRGFQHFLKKVIGKETHAIFRLVFVALEKEVVKNFSAILVADCKKRQAQKRRGALRNAAEQVRLIATIEGQRMDQVGAYQRTLEIVECCRSH